MTDREYIFNAIRNVEALNDVSRERLLGELIFKCGGWMPGSVSFWFREVVVTCSFHFESVWVFKGKLIELRGLSGKAGCSCHFMGIYFVYDSVRERLEFYVCVDGLASSRIDRVEKDGVGMCDLEACMKGLCCVVWDTFWDILETRC